MSMPQKTQSLITSLNTGNREVIAASLQALQATIEKSVAESTPIRQLINSGVKEAYLVAAVGMLITKYASLLSVGGNLKAGQEVEIAKMLLEEYPTASLDDFNLCLSRGTRGRYDEIFRFDVAVIFAWMQAYMEEWAEENERQWAKKKGDLKTAIEELPQSEKVDELLNNFLAQLKDGKDKMREMPKLTPHEIRKEGQAEPPRKKATASAQYLTTPEQAEQRLLKIEYGRLFTDLHTGKVKEGSPTFEDFFKI